MTKQIFGIMLAGLLSFSAYAQNNHSLTGSVADETNNNPIELAAVRLLSSSDSAFIKGTGSAKTGAFTFTRLDAGAYIIHVSFVGYADVYRPFVVSSSQTVNNIGKILMSPKAEELQEAVVTAKPVEMTVNNDTVEYNAEAFKTPVNSMLEDLIKRFPGAEVDKDGNITINGKQVKKILVHGKEFFSDDPKVASKNLPAEMFKTVQVYERKSDMAMMTGFDDGEEETVINLITKEGMRKGTLVNAMLGAGRDTPKEGDMRYEASGILNHMTESDRYTLMMGANNTNNMGASDMGGQRFSEMRGMRRGSGGVSEAKTFAFGLHKEFSPKLSLNGDISYNTSDRNSIRKVETETYMNQNINWLERQATNNEDISDNLGVNLRMEWKPDSFNTVIFRPNISYNKSKSYQDQIFEGFESFDGIQGDTLYTGNANSFNNGKGFNMGGTLEYSRKFGKKGRTLSFSLSGTYNNSYSQGISDWTKHIWTNVGGENLFSRDSILDQRSENDNNRLTYRAFVSYVEPLGRNNFLQFSYRLSKYDTENVNSTYDMIHNPSLLLDTAILNGNQSRSTSRDAVEQRISLKFKAVRQKYNYTFGVNLDPSNSVNKTMQPSRKNITTLELPNPYDERLPNIMGDSIVPGGLLEQNIINISPELLFNYLFDRRTNLRINYSGTMNQPSARQLADYEDYSNPMNVVRGNPNLKPSYSNRLTARFQKAVPDKGLSFTVNYQANISFNDIVSNTTTNMSDRSRRTTYDNINGNWGMSLTGTVSSPLKNRKFTVSNSPSLSYNNSRKYTNGTLNTTKNLSVADRGSINYRSDLFDLGVNASIRYQNVNNLLQPENSRKTYDWGVGGSTSWYLPLNFTIDSDVSFTSRNGYSEEFNISQTLWNASITKRLFNSKTGGVGSLKFKMYDILQQRKSINYEIGNGYIRNTESNSLTSLFTLSFIYRLNVFPGRRSSGDAGSGQRDRRFSGQQGERRGGGGQGGGGQGF